MPHHWDIICCIFSLFLLPLFCFGAARLQPVLSVLYAFRCLALTALQSDTLAWATGTRVGASDHAIALFVLNMVVSLGFCTMIHLHYICGLIVRIIVCLYMWL